MPHTTEGPEWETLLHFARSSSEWMSQPKANTQDRWHSLLTVWNWRSRYRIVCKVCKSKINDINELWTQCTTYVGAQTQSQKQSMRQSLLPLLTVWNRKRSLYSSPWVDFACTVFMWANWENYQHNPKQVTRQTLFSPCWQLEISAASALCLFQLASSNASHMDIQVGIAGCAERPMSMALAVCRKWVSRNSAQVQTTWLSCASEITQAEAVCFGNLS